MADIGQKLLEIGVIPMNAIIAPDKKKDLVRALDYLLPESDLVITTGGLGPTADDVTRAVIAEYFGREMHEDEKIVRKLNERWALLKRGEFPHHFLNQALVPEGADVLPNHVGTAPGLWIKSTAADGSEKHVAMLPGPPMELRPMFEESALPRIKEMQKGKLFSKLYFVSDMPESIVEGRIQPIITGVEKLSVAYCASPGNVKLFLTSPDEELLNEKSEKIRKMFSDNILADGCSTVAEDVSRLLREKNCKVSVAESCTGGMIASAITDAPGATDIFPGSLVVYSNELKEKLLGVKPEILERHGAVSEQCVREMVENVCEKFHAEAGMAVTGIAGPGGATNTKPVGLVYIAAKFMDKIAVEKCRFSGNREMVRSRTVSKAFNMLREMLVKK